MPKDRRRETVLKEWQAFGKRALAVGVQLVQHANFGDDEKYSRAVRVLAVCLMCRSVNQFLAMRHLMKNNLIVEARTMARGCFENLFWVEAIKYKRSDFLDRMIEDGDASLKTLGKELLAYSKKWVVEGEDLLQQAFSEVVAKKGRKIALKEEADAADMGGVYLLYRTLSRDAAHPSLESLLRHIEGEGDELVINGPGAWSTEYEDLESWEMMTTGFGNVIRSVHDILGAPMGRTVEEFWRQHGRINRRSGMLRLTGKLIRPK